MIVTTSWIEKNYNKFNNELWNGMLPTIKFKTNNSRKIWGYATYRLNYSLSKINAEALIMSNYYDSPEYVKIQTLLHEMIHIADYTFNPEHFIRYGRKVSARTYDAHGYWFKKEAKRISEISGYKITDKVTKSEINASSIRKNNMKKLEVKKNNAVVCVIYGKNGLNFYFKTDINYITHIKGEITKYPFINIGGIRKIKFYTFTNETLSTRRSCVNRLCGWYIDNIKTLPFLEKIYATEVCA